MMTMMKMAQPQFSIRDRDPLIKVYEDRTSMRSALERGPLPLADRVHDGVVLPDRKVVTDAVADPKLPSDVITADDVAHSPTIAKGLEPRDTTCSVLTALLDRDSEKKKEVAAKAAAKRLDAVILKRPAAVAASSGVKKGKHGGDSVPPLGCSKCRYLMNGCRACRLRRDEALRKKR